MLDGIRIVEFEGLGPAPFAAMMLAEMGAQVTVIHRKVSEQTPGKAEGNLLDRGKRSIALDLKDKADRQIAKALIRASDGLIEGMRPGVMERLGLGPEEAQGLNPQLVYGRMTGWGQDGPRSQEAGHDLNYLALSGLLFYAGLPGDVPAVPPTALGDIGGGALYLVAGMLAGLLQAQRTGEGTVVDAAIVDGASHMMSLLLSMGPQFSRTDRGSSLLDGPHWSRCYACACGRYVAVQCLEPKFYALFLEKMGLSDDPMFEEQFEPFQWDSQGKRLEELFARETRDHWALHFSGSDACVAPVLSPDEARRDSHVFARSIWRADGAPGPAPRFQGFEPDRTRRPATRDQNRTEVLAELRAKRLI